MELGGKRGHVSVEAVPVPLGRMPSVPLLFKNEFAQQSDELNSAFHSKHLIETGGKTIQDKIPEGFPYYWVTFGLVSGVLADLGGARGGLTSLLISSFAGQGLPPRHRRGPEGLRGSWGSRAEVCCLARRGQRARGVPQRLLRLRLDQAAAGGVSPVIGLFVIVIVYFIFAAASPLIMRVHPLLFLRRRGESSRLWCVVVVPPFSSSEHELSFIF